MSDSIKETTAKIKAFSNARGWYKKNMPKDMALSVCLEAAELMEHFQWVDEQSAEARVNERKEQISDEMADVAIYLLQFADQLGIDLGEAIEKKMEKNARKYPIGQQ